MKNLITLIIGLVLSLTAFAQDSIEYPKFEVDTNGQQVIVMTIEQAQSLDNSTDLLFLLEKINTQVGDYDSVCIQVINDKDIVIASQKIEISKLKESLVNKDEQIKTLQNQIYLYIKKVNILENEIDNREKVIKEKNSQIRKIKTKMVIGGIGGGATIIGLVLGILLIQN